eukprot:COSAG01_NODE_64153_length_277_cov_1.162921_1_plen_29_part_01
MMATALPVAGKCNTVPSTGKSSLLLAFDS